MLNTRSFRSDTDGHAFVFVLVSNIILLCVLCFQGQQFRFLVYFTSAFVKCCVVAVKRLSVLHHIAEYIFISFWIIEFILVTLKIEYRLNRC